MTRALHEWDQRDENHESGTSLVKLAKDREGEKLKAEIPSNPSAGDGVRIPEGMEAGG